MGQGQLGVGVRGLGWTVCLGWVCKRLVTCLAVKRLQSTGFGASTVRRGQESRVPHAVLVGAAPLPCRPLPAPRPLQCSPGESCLTLLPLVGS